MFLRDIERLIITREPITVQKKICRIISFTIVWAPQGVEYVVDIMDMQGKRYRATLSDLSYLDGRKSI